MGESYSQHYDFLWSCIHTSQELIKTIQSVSSKLDPDTRKLAREVILKEQRYIRGVYEDLKALNKWFKQSGLKKYELYYPQAYKDRLANMTDEELEWHMVKLEQIRDWYATQRG